MLHILRKLDGHREKTNNKINTIVSKLPENKRKEITAIRELDVINFFIRIKKG